MRTSLSLIAAAGLSFAGLTAPTAAQSASDIQFLLATCKNNKPDFSVASTSRAGFNLIMRRHARVQPLQYPDEHAFVLDTTGKDHPFNTQADAQRLLNQLDRREIELETDPLKIDHDAMQGIAQRFCGYKVS